MNRYKYIDENKEHLHTLDSKPLFGTSTITKVIAKPLTWWASGMAVSHFGWINSKNADKETRLKRASEVKSFLETLSNEEYLEILDKAYKAHNEKKELSAEAGTDMHELLENYVKECMKRNEIFLVEEDSFVGKFSKWSFMNIEKFTYSEVNCFSERMWTGGISDCGALMKDGKKAIIDFKSSKEAYHDQFIQIAGYDIQISENGGFTANGEKVMEAVKADCYIVIPFGAKDFEPVFRYNVDELKQGFESALVIYKIIK